LYGSVTGGRRRGAFAVLTVSLALGGCSSKSAGPGALADDSGSGDDATEPAGSVDSGPMMTVTGPIDSGSHPAEASTSNCGTRVNSGIMFSAAGVPYCAANMTCDLTQNTCCVNGLGVGSCMSGHNGCGAGLYAAFECIEATDCPSGQVCCGYADSTTSTAGSKCQDVSGNGNKCSPAPTTTQGSVQFCQKTCECKDGSECVPQSCNVGASLPANLTMCGLQSEKPYNCTAK
jgi:hypothetical protein